MSVGLIGKKLGMSQIFDGDGKIVPITIISLGPCFITQIKTEKGDGYQALQLAYGECRDSALNKPRIGHLKKSQVSSRKILREFRQQVEGFELGQELKCGDIFKDGDKVHISGRSKGRGFAGGVKRHGWRGGRKTHGSMFHRAPGSIGASAAPSRVFKGKSLPGHMGNVRLTVRNLQVVKVEGEGGTIAVRGAIPGAVGGIVEVRKAG